ncbi:MAG: energy-coupling factor transporter transmembrane protein EcfT [Treponema sp.]|jgi:energy-coupling factor transport system permease protein|nr:energy-coupling factor transporter transmembrane protein EcfT [Treponema sp.]
MPRELLQSEEVRGGLVLDPRTKLLLVFTVNFVLVGGGYGGVMDIIRPLLAAFPLIFLLVSRRRAAAFVYAAVYSVSRLGEMFLIQYTHGFLNSILLASCGIFARFMPGIMMGYFLVSTTTVSQFMAAMSRMHISEKLTIPLSVMFRFFPTVAEEYAAISDAMRMRGIRLAGGSPLAMLEYRLVPMMICCVKIGEELSASALTRGLGAPVRRTNLCKIGFHVQDIAAILLCLISLAVFLEWLIRMW